MEEEIRGWGYTELVSCGVLGPESPATHQDLIHPVDPAEKSKSRDFKGQRGGKGGGETWRPQEGFTA